MVSKLFGGCCHPLTHVSNLKVLPHEEVEGGAGVGSDGTYATAAAPQKSQAQVCTLLRLFFKQKFRELKTQIHFITPPKKTMVSMPHVMAALRQ